MVQTAVADVIGPAVAAVHPHTLFHQLILGFADGVNGSSGFFGGFQGGNHPVAHRKGPLFVLKIFQPGGEGGF